MQITNTSELRQMLLEEIDNVRKGTSDPNKAHAISTLASKVLQSAKLDLDVIKFNLANEGAAKSGDRILQLVNK